jgi:tryptophanyl-tRNA synthetase
LVGIYGAVTGTSVEQVLADFAGQGFGAFKPALADAVIALLTPLRARLEEFRKDPAMLDTLLENGAAKAAALAAPTLAQAYQAVGLTRRSNA